MKQKILYSIWAYLYILCGIAGHVSQRSVFHRALFLCLGIAFFVPGGILLAQSLLHNCRKGVLLIRWISAGSLILTLVALIANIAAVNAGETVGKVLHVVLIWLSCPMVCCGYWALSLFLWSCLLCASFLKPKKA